MDLWKPCTAVFPLNTKLLLSYLDYKGDDRIVLAYYAPDHTNPCSCDTTASGWNSACECDYDEGEDQSYQPEGWYEFLTESEDGGDYSALYIREGFHWMEIPEPPK